jgi:death on curing protein
LGVSRDEVKFLTPDQIREINFSMCHEFGGLWVPPDNLRLPGSLEFLIDRLSGEVFDRPKPVDLFAAAALQLVYIAQRHVFNDGNKRTALHVAWEFLAANGVEVQFDSSAETLALDSSDGRVAEADVERWLRNHTK